jgi:sarcosine oxidase subunit alpha
MARLVPLRDPVTILFNGERVVSERNEPVAAALVAAGKISLARSAKFHRPRGPSCLRGACDGCLARVDERPNVMTCLVPAAEGTKVETQNTLGSRNVDLLRVTDWFFPEGMNHHELFAGVPGVQQVMEVFARRVAGLGKLPKDLEAPRHASRREADVVVVGAGAAGMSAAVRLAKRGRAVEVVDDALESGGGVTALAGEQSRSWEPLRRAFGEEVGGGRIAMRTRTTAAGFYGDDLLVVGEAGAQIVTAHTVVLAPGAHDGVLAFENNDLPGILSARAAGWLLARGITLGERVVVVVAPGGGPFGDAYARTLGIEAVRGVPVSARGTSHVKHVTVATSDGEKSFDASAVVIEAPRAPSYELCAQAGAKLDHEPRGFVVRTDGGKIRDGVFAVGEAVGTPLDAEAIAREADAVARGIP